MDLIKEAAKFNIEVSEKANENLGKYEEMMLRGPAYISR